MPSNPPLTSSGRREPIRARPIPPKVKAALLYLVHGLPDDDRSIDLVEAARLAGLQGDQFRRWLDRSQVKAFLRAERKIALEALTAGNPKALVRVRDKVGGNAMASVAAVRAIEDMLAAENGRHAGGLPSSSPGLTIVIQSAPPQPAAPVTIEAEARPTLRAPYVTLPEPKPEPRREPIFKP